MVSSAFRINIALRLAALFLTFATTAWLLVNTKWYVFVALCVLAALVQTAMLMRFVTQSIREVARLLDAISVDDTSQGYSRLAGDASHREFEAAMSRVSERLRAGRSEREQQALYWQALLSHVPVALICVQESREVQLLNMAARRLFESPLTEAGQFARYGEGFAAEITSLSAGGTVILSMERSAGNLLVKAAVTEFVTGSVRRRLISLQNIDNELSEKELAAWQMVIRVLAHEVMNSLTPVSSLATTAHDLVSDVLKQLPPGHPGATALVDAREALDTVARRSEGLVHFVRNHHHLTKRLSTRVVTTPVHQIFGRLQRLLASDLASRDIKMMADIEPEMLEVTADPNLLDQALINLVRNAVEALRSVPAGFISLCARRDPEGRVIIAVADNGPGIAPALRDKIFVPFFSTKRQGSGVGLTIVRQIATAHGARVDVSQTRGGGATVSLRF
jgi:nitrogen fixation/metabolism regulation signal transduction histidine kinase